MCSCCLNPTRHATELKQSFICLETKEIFITKKELREYLNLSISMFNKYINDNCLKYNNYTYVPIKEYINCPVYK